MLGKEQFDYQSFGGQTSYQEPSYGVHSDADDFESTYFSPEVKDEYQPMPERQAVEYVEEKDDMPSITTMQFTNKSVNPLQDYRPSNETDSGKEYKINARGKVLVTVYALVILTIFALIVLNTRLLKSMDTTISQKQAKLQELKAQSQVLSDELDFVSSDEEIERKAIEMGMIKE